MSDRERTGVPRGRGNRAVGIGIVGCGFATANLHLPALAGLRQARVVALADLDSGARDRLGEQFGVQRRYPSAAELAADPDVEAVGVIVPASHHRQVTGAALEAGKHVLVEKPLALKLDDCEEMVAAAHRQPGLVTMVAFNLRCHRLVRAARAKLAAGAVGKPEALWSVTSGQVTGASKRSAEWFGKRAMGGGTILEKGPHHYDLWRYLLDDEVEEVFAFGRSDSRMDDVVSVVSGRMRGGALVSTVLVHSPTESNEVTVSGSGGRADVDIHRFDGLRVRPAGAHTGGVGFRLRSAVGTLRGLPAGLRSLRRGGDFVASYAEEWRHFLGRVRNGGPSDSSFEDGLAAARIAAAAVESVTAGIPVRVESATDDVASVGQDRA